MIPVWKDIVNHRNILVDIVKDEKAKIIAEIGVWKCGLTKKLLRSCGNIIVEYWAVDSWKVLDNPEDEYENDMFRYVRTTEMGWNDAYLYACKLMRFFPQLHVIRSTSILASKLFPEKYFDLVFIDADHRYNYVLTDIKAWLPLVKKGGFLAGHDYKIQHKGTMKAVDECFGNNVTIIENSSVWIHKIGK